ncbi:MAG: oligoendopeptidase F [Calditrichaceae bacterium]|nr:oligoendopeptidase F [Calditrichaceae bacterium]MBN2709481.1 oligoendopeptidase F [Calditrichaceae bacterium]RQV94806.1 MAG: oligoendopeptidase F [Calditrichota bacterium]
MKEIQKLRPEIGEQYKWNLGDIFPGNDAWENAFRKVQDSLPELEKFKGTLDKSAHQLRIFLEKANETEEILGKLHAYAHMHNDEDKTVPIYQELYDRVNGLLVEYHQKVSFFEPEILLIDQNKIESFLQEDADLRLYRQFLDDILRKKTHTLTVSEEKLMALSGEVRQAPVEIFSVWDSADIVFPFIKDETGKSVQLSNALYGKYQQRKDRRLRKDSYTGLYKPFIEHRNTLAQSYSSIVKSHIFNARARHYKNTLEAALDINHIDPAIYHNLIQSARANLAPLQRYNALRKKILNLKDGVHDYDLRASLFETRAREYSWEEAKDLCIRGMQPLGEEYTSILKKGFTESWIDVYENKGKRTGAYSSGAYGVHPYVLMNYNDTLGDVFTLAHEMGHALHTWYTINNQPYVYGDYPIFLAEVASTVNEALLQQYMIDNAGNKEEKLAYLNAYLDKFSQTFYRQVLFAEFELRTHEMVEKGQALTADKLDDLFGELYQQYHGADFVLIRENKALWSRIPHFYYDYYVFQYSTSFTASIALVDDIMKNGESACRKYLAFLKSGRSKYAIDTLMEAGVDMRSPEPVNRALKLMDDLLDEIERLSD